MSKENGRGGKSPTITCLSPQVFLPISLQKSYSIARYLRLCGPTIPQSSWLVLLNVSYNSLIVLFGLMRSLCFFKQVARCHPGDVRWNRGLQSKRRYDEDLLYVATRRKEADAYLWEITNNCGDAVASLNLHRIRSIKSQ